MGYSDWTVLQRFRLRREPADNARREGKGTTMRHLDRAQDVTSRRTIMVRISVAVIAVVITLAAALAGQAPRARVHRLEATPATVAYGYYWAGATPVLRIASGDIID